MFFVSPFCLVAIKIKSMPSSLSWLFPLQFFFFSVLHLIIAVGFGPWFITRFTRLLLHGSNNQKCNSSKFAFQRVLAEGNSFIRATLEHNSDSSAPRRKTEEGLQKKKKIFCPSLIHPSFCCQLKRRDSTMCVLTQERDRARWWGQALLRQYRGLVPPWPRLGMLPHSSYILWYGIWVTRKG